MTICESRITIRATAQSRTSAFQRRGSGSRVMRPMTSGALRTHHGGETERREALRVEEEPGHRRDAVTAQLDDVDHVGAVYVVVVAHVAVAGELPVGVRGQVAPCL